MIKPVSGTILRAGTAGFCCPEQLSPIYTAVFYPESVAEFVIEDASYR